MSRLHCVTACLAATLLLSAPTGHAVDHLNAPPGFVVELLTDAVPNARQMAWHDAGLLFVGTRRAGKVYAVDLRDEQAKVHTFASDLTMPSGIALDGDTLYIAALDRVLRYDAVNEAFANRAPSRLVTSALPDERHHGWKYLRVAPDGDLIVPVGAPCNICKSDDERFASILRMDTATGETTVIAHGVRNSVGFDHHPETGELWFSDNGRDHMGDDVPPCEINRLSEAGQHFGYPHHHGDDVIDPEFGKGVDVSTFIRPELNIQAHAAPIGIAFHHGNGVPETYRNALFIAERGSWNRSSKVGHLVTVLRFGANGERSYEPFLTGFLDGQTALGRPNDVLPLPNGDVLVSDDKAGAIYRVRWTGKATERDLAKR